MIQFVVNDKEYLCIEKWEEMPLSKAVELYTACKKEMPENLKRYYDILLLTDEALELELENYFKVVTSKELKENLTFYIKVLSILSNVDSDVCNKILPAFRVAFYKKHLELFVFGLVNYPINFEIKGIKSFMHEGIEYHLPETKTVLGVEKPFFDRTAIEFTEAADLEMYGNQLAGGRYEVAANLISVMCRPKVDKTIEPYNEQTCLVRAKQFENITMDKVFEVFFCLQEHITLSNQHIQLYIQEQLINRVNPLKVAASKTMDGMQVL